MKNSLNSISTLGLRFGWALKRFQSDYIAGFSLKLGKGMIMNKKLRILGRQVISLRFYDYETKIYESQ